ncbi:MAG: response regulator [Acidobacteria bacterium]|nr:response regulator [Acidobacteriota bacterium]
MGVGGRESALTAILVSPDRAIARSLIAANAKAKALQILGDLKVYPTPQTLDMRLRQLEPDTVLVDLATGLDQGLEVIRHCAAREKPPVLIGIHATSHPDAVVRSLRVGASEFLHTPFDGAVLTEAVARIQRLREPDAAQSVQFGRLIMISAAKPGSGATTLSAQVAFSLRRQTGGRVLLIDFDLLGGAMGFYLKLPQERSVVDVIGQLQQVTQRNWRPFIVSCHGVDVLPAPEIPHEGLFGIDRMHDFLELVRSMYDWVLVDLPSIFHRNSLFALPEADQALLISTAELPSLHLARKAVNMLNQVGFGKDRYRIVINRFNKKSAITQAEMETIFNSPIHATLPNDYFSMHRAVTLAQPLAGDTDLAKAVDALAKSLTAAAEPARTPAGEPQPAGAGVRS